MSDYDRDRGAYSPTSESPLAFDARDPSGRGAGRPPVTLIVSALILLVLIFALIFFYRSGVRHTGQPPVVGQPLGDIRQAPPPSAQPTEEAAGLQIYGAGHEPPTTSAAPAFAPPPEEPLPRPAQSTPQARTANLPTQPRAAAPTPTAALPQAAAQPALRSATAVPAPAPTQPAAAQPVPTATPVLAVVQIGAFSSPALAEKGWSDVARVLPGEMVGRTKKVETFAKGAETFYRAYVGGFGSKGEASAFCADLKAAGHDCIVK